MPKSTTADTTLTSVEAEISVEEEESDLDEFAYPGVETVRLSEETQDFIHCKIGPDVNCQYPWIEIDKKLILDHVEMFGPESEFADFEEPIELNPEFIILLGLIVDESKDTDEFYICLTKDAREYCREKADTLMRLQEEALEKATVKKPEKWEELGSEIEISELVPINLRSLYEVDVVAKYPQSNQVKFFVSRDANSCRDCYGEITNVRDKYNNVFRKRVDCGIQSVFDVQTKVAQTGLKYPKNAYTQTITISEGHIKQAEVDSDNDSEDNMPVKKYNRLDDPGCQRLIKQLKRPSYIKLLNSFASSSVTKLENVIDFNIIVDLYHNDYPELAKFDTFDSEFHMKFSEYICFTDVRTNKKYISCSQFHTMWAGIVAITYSDTNPGIYKSVESTEDPVQRAVYGMDPVFIWSHTDSLEPKLVLQTPRDLKTLAFCPFDENLLVGGCANGQLAIWDLTNCLSNAESVEIKTEIQERYSIAMGQHMTWMKDVHQKSVVPYTAVSLLMYSHTGPITQIKWLSPNFTATHTGLIRLLGDHENRSKVLLTASEDGSVLIWNLSLDNVVMLEGKKIKRSKRVLKKPDGLLKSSSPYSILNRNLKPIFKIILGITGEAQTCAIQSLNVAYPKLAYKERMVNDNSGRKYYDCIILPDNETDMPQSISCGTIYGEVLKANWTGLNISSGQIVHSEYCKFIFRASLHDGVVTETLQNPFIDNIYLTTGGKIFAIWSENLENKPVVWKKHSCWLTLARWSRYKASVVFVTTSDGTIETYDFSIRSDIPIATQTLSGGQITNISVHHRTLKHDIIGIGDLNAAFTLFFSPPIFQKIESGHVEVMQKYLDNELLVKASYNAWYKKFVIEHPDIFETIKQRELIFLEKKEKERLENLERLELEREAEAERRRILKSHKPTPQEKWRAIIDKLIEKTIALKKSINMAELLEKERPLKELEKQRIAKEKLLLEALKHQNTIFDETVAILFPEVAKLKSEEEGLISKEQDDYMDEKTDYIEQYESLKHETLYHIDKRPFHHVLNWNGILAEGMERRRSLYKLGTRRLGVQKRYLPDFVEKPTKYRPSVVETDSDEKVSESGEI